MSKEEESKLLGRHYELQTMQTQRKLGNSIMKKQEREHLRIEEEDEKESEELGVEEDLEENMAAEEKAKQEVKVAASVNDTLVEEVKEDE